MRKLIFTKIIFVFLVLNMKVFSKEIEIIGNEFTDAKILMSIIDDLPDTDDKSKSNYILKKLNNSGLFQSVEVSHDDLSFKIKVIEFPSINKFFYEGNERIKDEEIDTIVNELEVFTLSNIKLNDLVEELKKIYQSFGFNNIEIQIKNEIYDNNSSDVFLNFNEGKITKIKKINIFGNDSFDDNVLLTKIKSKTKNLKNIFANNNFKIYQLNNDLIRISNFYKSKGFKNVNVNYEVEYFDNNKVDINFKINEGKIHFFSSLDVKNSFDLNSSLENELNQYIKNKTNFIGSIYNSKSLDILESDISKILELAGLEFFELNVLEKLIDNKADILVTILPTEPVYINQINISGNYRTYDYVFRRELKISEGDPLNRSKINEASSTLNRLPFVGNVEIKTTDLTDSLKDVEIEVDEVQTGSFNVGLSLGTLDGASFVSGLKENNFRGTGRSLEFLLNTNNNNNEFVLSTSDKFILNSEVEHGYAFKYRENDYSKSKSYKLNTFTIDTSFNYLLSDDVNHTLGLGYSIKDYKVTDTSTVSDSIKNSSGESISFNFINTISKNTLNSFIRPTNGNYFSLTNELETPSSSSNGFVKNTLTGKKYYELDRNVFSIQARLGNIYSLNNNEILSDDKFSLGGRWLRGFDSFGAGPRNSRSAYVGGNNLAVAKFDFSRPITLSEQNPIYFYLFNDYGTVWGNKNDVTSSDTDIRSSYGFGFNYYSPIGPIGFTWGFPISHKDYDIKRMFMFSIGNLN